jgi:meso-butanediol dehydrogenase/(S,S)-butanediol dehydrogenase/diacetyl reductase
MSRLDEGRFAGRTALVTAAASGIGLATARKLASEGANLVLSDLRLDELEARAGEIDAPGIVCCKADVRSKQEIEAFVLEGVSTFGRIDVLVNNAGIGRRGRVQDLEDQDWRLVMETTLDSVFLASRAALPYLAITGGTIVNVASISGLAGDGGNAAYNAAKGAVVNLTRAMAVDHGPDGIRVNAVCPGLTVTPLTAKMRASELVMAQYADRIPLGRAGEAGEIASAIAFLASDEASYISGMCLAVDGGLTAWTGQPVWRPKR